MKFSACWIVKNEADNIQKSILSVKDCCDELIVVDTGSDDDTVRIAKKCGARIARFKWINDFSAAKNYALSLAKGDYVIFLDGDESFDPPLTKENREEFRKVFEDSGADTLRIPRYEVETKDNSVKGIQLFDRILRRGAVHYENKVHEIPRREDGQEVRFGLMGGYKLVHTGYSLDMVQDKTARNIAILEGERSRLKSPAELYMNASYLMREYMILRDEDKACECCQYLLAHHECQKEVCARYHRGYLQRIYQAIQVAVDYPDRFHRKEVYERLFCGIKENYPDTRDAALADLHYQLRFHYREDRFLREVEEIEPKLEEMPLSGIVNCRQVESLVFERAAEAVHMRQDAEKALRWARHAMLHSQTLDSRPLQIILYFLRGNPPDLFADFICELVDMENRDISSIVMWILHAEEYQEVYELLLARGMPPAKDDDLFARVRGIQGADGFDPMDIFRAKMEMANVRMKYADIAHDLDADEAASICAPCAHFVAHARVMLGEYDQALSVIASYLDAGQTDYNLLKLLLVIDEKGSGKLRTRARKYYREFTAILDEKMALDDVVNTGAVYQANPEEERRKLKRMTAKAFFELLEKDAMKPITNELLATHEQAASVFEQNGCVLQAAASHRLLLAKTWNRKQSAEHLERLFRECGNDTAAKQIAAYASVWK